MFLDKNKVPTVAVEFMNNIHYEEVDLLNQIVETIKVASTNNDKIVDINNLLNEFLNHTIEHFEIENQHMQTYNFFAYDCHKGEHDRVLNELKEEIADFSNSKDLNKLELYFKENITNWMLNHISTMDFVTANYISQFKNSKI